MHWADGAAGLTVAQAASTFLMDLTLFGGRDAHKQKRFRSLRTFYFINLIGFLKETALFDRV